MIIIHNLRTSLWYVVDARLNLAVSINLTEEDAIKACARNGWTIDNTRKAA